MALFCAAKAGQAHPEDHFPVATIFGYVIYADDLVHESAVEKMKAKLDPDAFDVWYARARENAMRSQVWSAIFANYHGVKNIEATQLETNLHLVFAAKLRAERRTRRERERDALTAELKSPSLSEARRKTIEGELAGSTAWLDKYDLMEKERHDPKREKIRAGLDQRASERAVVKWKVSQAIFREFGGRITFGRDGWEPFDAYRKLVDREEAEKDIQFHDPLLRKAFFNSFSHDFHYSTEKQAQFYFEKPYWERSAEEMKNAGFKDVTELSKGEFEEL